MKKNEGRRGGAECPGLLLLLEIAVGPEVAEGPESAVGVLERATVHRGSVGCCCRNGTSGVRRGPEPGRGEGHQVRGRCGGLSRREEGRGGRGGMLH